LQDVKGLLPLDDVLELPILLVSIGSWIFDEVLKLADVRITFNRGCVGDGSAHNLELVLFRCLSAIVFSKFLVVEQPCSHFA
jgi:hypothetical protein